MKTNNQMNKMKVKMKGIKINKVMIKMNKKMMIKQFNQMMMHSKN